MNLGLTSVGLILANSMGLLVFVGFSCKINFVKGNYIENRRLTEIVMQTGTFATNGSNGHNNVERTQQLQITWDNLGFLPGQAAEVVLKVQESWGNKVY